MSEIIKNYSSLIYRRDLSNAKYKFEFPIDQNMSEEEIRNELIEDIFKLTLSIRKHTGGVKHISDEDKEPAELDASFLERYYGGKQYILYVIFPSKMEQPNPKKILHGYNILIPGRPIARKINRYWSKIDNIISTNGAKKRIADPCVKQIMEEVIKYGIENINSLDFYVFEEADYSNKSYYYIIMTFNFKDEDSILTNRYQNKINAERLAKEKAEIKKRNEEQLEKDREDYLRRKNEYLSNFSGPDRYYAEKDWLRTYGDSRFEDFGSMSRSNYTGD